jgi:hypothetical protein
MPKLNYDGRGKEAADLNRLISLIGEFKGFSLSVNYESSFFVKPFVDVRLRG